MPLPKCGLYRTGIALPSHATSVPQGRLVYFHNHSEQGPPIVLLPKQNVHNHWSFNERGYLVKDAGSAEFLVAMVPLPEQGFYVVQQQMKLNDQVTLPPRSLVQVGYNPQGHAILFPAQPRDNGFWFAESGFRFEGLEVFKQLKHAGFQVRAPEVVEERLLH